MVGFDIDLAKELCKRINTQCTFVENPLDALIPSLKAKKIDAIMSSLSITESASRKLPSLTSCCGRFASGGEKGSPVTPDLATLKGKRVGRAAGDDSGNLWQ